MQSLRFVLTAVPPTFHEKYREDCTSHNRHHRRALRSPDRGKYSRRSRLISRVCDVRDGFCMLRHAHQFCSNSISLTCSRSCRTIRTVAWFTIHPFTDRGASLLQKSFVHQQTVTDAPFTESEDRGTFNNQKDIRPVLGCRAPVKTPQVAAGTHPDTVLFRDLKYMNPWFSSLC